MISIAARHHGEKYRPGLERSGRFSYSPDFGQLGLNSGPGMSEPKLIEDPVGQRQ